MTIEDIATAPPEQTHEIRHRERQRRRALDSIDNQADLFTLFYTYKAKRTKQASWA